MKKIWALLLVFVMILPICMFGVFAETEIVKVTGNQYSLGSPAEKGTSSVMARPASPVGFKVSLPYTSGAMKLTYRTASGENGIINIRLGNQAGEIIGTLETYKIADSWDLTYENIIGFTRPVTGEQDIWVTVEKSPTGAHGSHWIYELEFLEYDATQTSGEFSTSNAFIDIEDDPNRHEINMLADLGLFNNEEKKFVPYLPMTRIDFVGILGNLINAKQYRTENSPFKDVKKGSENADLLSGLYQMGIIKGDTEGNFRPTSFITPAEAAAVCTNALGYKAYAKDMNAVLDLANTLDLFDGLDLTNKITKSDGAKLIYNLILADYLAVKEMSQDDIFYNPTKNYLENATHYKHATGVMTANNITGLHSPKKSIGLKIDNKIYVVKKGINVNYLGVKCEFFYHEEDGENVLDAIRPVPKAELSTVQSTPDVRFDAISERELKYTIISEDEEFEYELDAKTAIIYNGIALTKSLATLIPDTDAFEGTVTIIDNNADGILETIWIDHVTHVIKVGAVSSGRIKDELTNSLYDTTDKNFALFVDNKSSMLEELSAGTYLTLFESATSGRDKYVRAMAVNNTVEGQITSMSNGKYTINDTEYVASSYLQDELYVGLSGTFILDKYDYILACEEGATSELKLGVYLANDNGSPTSLDSVAMVKLFTEQGIEKFKVAKKVIADGATVKSVDGFYDGVGAFTGMSNVITNSPVLYRINSAGELSVIDTINDGTKDKNDQLKNILDVEDADPVNSVTSGSYYIYYNTLSNGTDSFYGIKPDAKVLAVSSTGAESGYRIIDGLKGSDIQISLAPYTTNRDSMLADVVVIRDYGEVANIPASPVMVDCVTEAVDNEGNVVKKIVGYSHTAKVEHIVDVDAYTTNSTLRTLINSLKKGDLVRPMLTNNKLTDLSLVYIPQAAQGETFGPSANDAGVATLVNRGARRSGRFFLAEVVNTEEKFIKINCQSLVDGVWTDNEYLYNATSAMVGLCEKGANGTYKFSFGMPLDSLVKDDIVVCYRGSAGVFTSIFAFRDSSQ